MERPLTVKHGLMGTCKGTYLSMGSYLQEELGHKWQQEQLIQDGRLITKLELKAVSELVAILITQESTFIQHVMGIKLCVIRSHQGSDGKILEYFGTV
jgi:hypothetical protein